ncbi:helix-turn-helix domain-containing protein [Spirosoma arcticum]
MKITNWDEHRAALSDLDKLIAAGFEGGAQREAQFSKLAISVEAFENSIPLMPIRVPETLPGMIHIKMAERNMKQKEMAQFLDVSMARFSEVITGKRRITIDLAKKLHERSDISPEFILKTA